MCSARVITRWWKFTTGLAVGTVSWRQGRPLWGGVWKKSDVWTYKNYRGQSLGLTNRNYIKGILEWTSLINKTKSDTARVSRFKCSRYMRWGWLRLPEEILQAEKSVVTMNCKKSAEVIVPRGKKFFSGRIEWQAIETATPEKDTGLLQEVVYWHIP